MSRVQTREPTRLELSLMAADALIVTLGPELHPFLLMGKEEVIRVCRERFRGHAFRAEDYERIHRRCWYWLKKQAPKRQIPQLGGDVVAH